MAVARRLFMGWLFTLKTIAGDKGVLIILALAPLIYGFFYPWPYGTQTVTQVPVAVVDLDHTSLSRQLTRFARASPHLNVRLVTGDESAAQQALWSGEVEGYVVLPRDLKRNVLRGSPAVVTVQANGAYALLNKAVLTGFSESIGTVSAGVELMKLQVAGQSALQAAVNRSPIGTQTVALFNPTQGYGSFVVPAVALLILQQTLLMGVGMLVGLWTETGFQRTDAATWVGRLLAFCTVGYANGLLYFGWIFWLQDFPRGGNPGGALLLLACYIPAVCSMGALLGLWFGNRERALQVLLFTALPAIFVSGFSWPEEALPEVLQGARWLLPSTAGIQASLKLNQMGAPVSDVSALLAILVGLALFSAALLLRLANPPSGKKTENN
ncbi:MAG: ABC transporter permease [Rhodoferax sp.]|jgi:ABC-2 type transport system permease protein|uniref:ABC transporter permease n=1 Tax=Rhodoferax sp. TaxID=50421 RepID=UPI001B4DE588|nr:ABC transporter permease [Rhodoferax sp.]MBP8285767.1 ABC transporter permease [Rhodoferax sp.]MBP9147511.1 ABC transporter permease [Rhodoferax sp.]MBP9734389.1 ABC transporter permease [Rhodoferax sp.]